MSTTHLHSKKTQQKVAQHDSDYVTPSTDTVFGSDSWNDEHSHIDKHFYFPSSNLTQATEVSSLQTESRHFEYHTLTGLNPTINPSVPKMNPLQHYPNSQHMHYLNVSPGQDSLTQTQNSPSYVENNIYFPTILPIRPATSFPSEISAYPVTTCLTSLPHQIARALDQRIPVSSLSQNSVSPGSTMKVIHTPDFSSPSPTQVIPTFPHTQEIPLQDQPKHIHPGTSPLENSPNWHFDQASSLHVIDRLEETKFPPEVKESFSQLGPLLTSIRSPKWPMFLVRILRQVHHNIPLDDFYNILYSETPLLTCLNNTKDPDSGETLKALQLFHLVLITFQSPRVTAGLLGNVSTKELRIPVIQLQEILRTSLAIKIIFALVKIVDPSSMGFYRVSRVAVYKIYYILCQKLTQKFPAFSNYPGFREALTLGQLRLGKITNLVYPNIVTRKIGPRGDSKSHYMGLTLDYSILDEDTIRLAELEIPELMKHFNDDRAISKAGSRKLRGESNDKLTDVPVPTRGAKPCYTHSVTSSEKPLPSYIDSWSVYSDNK